MILMVYTMYANLELNKLPYKSKSIMSALYWYFVRGPCGPIHVPRSFSLSRALRAPGTLAFTLTTYDTLYYPCYTPIEQDIAHLLVGQQDKALIVTGRA